MSLIREYLEEKRLIGKSLFTFFPLRTGARSLLFLSLFLSLPFVFRLLTLYEEERGLKRALQAIESKMVEEKRGVERLRKDLSLSQDSRWLEYKLMEKLGVVPKGAIVVEMDGR
jgi:hypothetical protein